MEPGVEFWTFWFPGLGTRGALWLRHVACTLGCVCMCVCVLVKASGIVGTTLLLSKVSVSFLRIGLVKRESETLRKTQNRFF